MKDVIKIAIAEDNSFLLQSIKEKLGLFDYLKIKHIVCHGVELMEKLEQNHQVDVILMDIQMPEMNGIEATNLVKSKYPHIKVIMLTVFDDDENIFRSIQAVNTNGVINVTGSDSNAKQASIVLYNVTETGTYTVGGIGNSNSLRWTEGLGQNDTYSANGVIGSGTITVTELSTTKVKGTFSFTGINTAQVSKSITDGVFEATF